jgi:hypothetical protein
MLLEAETHQIIDYVKKFERHPPGFDIIAF